MERRFFRSRIISPEQSRAARAMLGWSQAKLAEEAKVTDSTVQYFETGLSKPRYNSLARIRRAFEDGNVEFLTDGYGVAVAIGGSNQLSEGDEAAPLI